MKLVQVHEPDGRLVVGYWVEDEVILFGVDLPPLALLCAEAFRAGKSLEDFLRPRIEKGPRVRWSELNRPPNPRERYLAVPIEPDEVWACGVTYRRSAEFREEESTTSRGIYDRVYFAERPELFFKTTGLRCVGPNDAIGCRTDSSFTAPEPELALLLNPRGEIQGYTFCNDVSAWDLERENPLYLPQSKTYARCCALGPALVTPSELRAVQGLEVRCAISRAGNVIFSGAARVSQMKRSFEELITFLLRSNVLPPATVLSTGTGIIVPPSAALRPGDEIEISAGLLGALKTGVCAV